jgi:2-methylcitrate dehydratase PrpD
VEAPVRALAAGCAAGPSWTPLGRLRPRDAALVNGVAGTWLDYDLGHRWSGGHPAIHTLAAALAVAEEQDRSGEDLLLAFVAGCEVACRIGVAMGGLAPGLHPHGSWPALGAAVAACLLRGFSGGQIRAALETGSTLTLVTSWRTAFSGASIRNIYAGYGAELAVRLPDLALAGWDGEPDGVGVVFGGIAGPSLNRARATLGLGDQWEFTRSYLKPYPFARFGHAAVDALRAMRDERSFEPDEVESIWVGTYTLGAMMRERRPASQLQALFSIPHAFGALLTRGRLDPDCFRPASLSDPAIRAVAERVTVEEDAGWAALNPRWRGATVRARLRDGSALEREVSRTWGDPERPMSDEEVREKFRSLVAPVRGVAAAEAGLRAVDGIAGLARSRDLTAALE